MIGSGLGVDFHFNRTDLGPVALDSFERFQHVLDGPLARLAFSVTSEERLQSLGHLPLQITRQETDKDVTSDPIIELMTNRAHFQGDGFQVPKAQFHQTQTFVGEHQRQ